MGQIVAPFGVKGELKVNILTEFPDRFSTLEQIVLAPFSSIPPGPAPTAALNPRTARAARLTPVRGDAHGAPTWKPPKEPTPFKIESTHIHKGQLLLKLESIDTANQAEALRGYWVVIPIAQAKKLPRGAYFIYQIVGLEVYTKAGEYLGKIEDVLTTSANDVYVIKGPGVKDPTGELLVPAIKSVVLRMEMKRGRIIVADLSEWV